jgi:hypothetical protein
MDGMLGFFNQTLEMKICDGIVRFLDSMNVSFILLKTYFPAMKFRKVLKG